MRCPAATSGTVAIKSMAHCNAGDFSDAAPALVHKSEVSGARIRIMDYVSQAVEVYLERHMWPELYSIVIPLYRSEGTIADVVDEVTASLAQAGVARYEIILVNDCSPDRVLDVATRLAQADSHIVVLDLAKNVGQERACLAGYEYASGDYIIDLDDDMQTPGTEVGRLIEAIHERNDDIVFASYIEQEGKRPFIRRIGTWLNWRMAEVMMGKPRGLETNSFLIMKRFVRDNIIHFSCHDMYTFGIMFATTSHMSNLPMIHRKRAMGVSGNSFRKLVRLWLSGALGFSMGLLRFLWILALVSIAASIILICLGCQISALMPMILICLVAICLIGEYVGRLYLESENLPMYTIRQVIKFKNKQTY